MYTNNNYKYTALHYIKLHPTRLIILYFISLHYNYNYNYNYHDKYNYNYIALNYNNA